jgi:hypothetical protein
MQCPHCDQEHPEGTQCCQTTGIEIIIPQGCPGCGKPVESSWLHCGHCGRKLGQVVEKSDQQETQGVGFPLQIQVYVNGRESLASYLVRPLFLSQDFSNGQAGGVARRDHACHRSQGQN